MSPTVEAPALSDVDRLASAFKALGDPVRLRLLSLIASAPGAEACVCDLNEAFELSQPTISHHLKQLQGAGLVSREKRGVWAYFRVNRAVLGELAQVLADASNPHPSARTHSC